MAEVLLEVDDRVAVVTLNRPEARNALNRAIRTQLPRVMAECEDRDDIDVVILTGADPAFCAGVDLKEFGSGAASASGERFGGDMGARDGSGNLPWRGALGPHAKLVIGAINGVAVTGGFELALACDFLVASERARFADTHARVGVMPGWGLTVLLAQRIGIARAKQLSVTGNYLDAPRAYEWGLVNEVVAHDDLLEHCRRLALDCISIDQRAVRQMLATYNAVTDTTIDDGWTIEGRISREWEGSGFDPVEIESKRAAIVARGREQIS
jgi:enoyl-CoA hydratase